jgi:restriction system protein
MPRYWVIAPVESKDSQRFNNVWQFDLDNKLISIGWSELGDISKMSREALSEAVVKAYPDGARGLIVNMLWAFYHEIVPGDFVIARRGRKILEAVGKVVRTGFYAAGKNPYLASPEYSHPNFLEVEWQSQPRNKVFPKLVFPMQTLKEIIEVDYQNLLGAVDPENVEPPEEPITEGTDRNAFVLEKYLEEFIVSNFKEIFKGKMKIYEDDSGAEGQQYDTDIGIIDILAIERESNSFVVIELKKGQPSDMVVGQILRYMGWVKRLSYPLIFQANASTCANALF